MENMGDANRAIQRLNGFALYGSRLVVKIARDKHDWKRNTAGRSQSFEPKQTGNVKDDDAVVQKMVAKGSIEVDTGNGKLKRITGHVENEDLWKLRRCLVGVMDTGCSVSSIHNRLLKWGLERARFKWEKGTNRVDHLGFDDEIIEGSNKQLLEPKKNWADSLNEKLNAGKSWSRLSNVPNTSEEELGRGFFADIEEKKGKMRKKKAKKFGSLLEIQNNSISGSERRKRDKALKKRNWSKYHLEEFELSVDMRFLTWNVHGMGSDVKISVVRRMVRLHKIDDLFFIQETKKVDVKE
ncbi:hypothetical protein GQ457_05G026470 [Hibiscus cannabinus]